MRGNVPVADPLLDVIAVVVLPLLATFCILRLDVGPVLVVLISDHGVHVLDVVVILIVVPLWLVTCHRTTRWFKKARARFLACGT